MAVQQQEEGMRRAKIALFFGWRAERASRRISSSSS
jgi:hypothetical protein